MEFVILALIAFLALAYLYFSFKKILGGKPSCNGTCSANCKSKKSCKKASKDST